MEKFYNNIPNLLFYFLLCILISSCDRESSSKELEEKTNYSHNLTNRIIKNNTENKGDQTSRIEKNSEGILNRPSSSNTSNKIYNNDEPKNDKKETALSEQSTKDFITKWKFIKDEHSFTIPLKESQYLNYNFVVDWGDESPQNEVSSFDDLDKTHVYELAGEYTIKISGICEGFQNVESMINMGAHSSELIEVLSLGDMDWKDLSYAFALNYNLTNVSFGDTSQVTNMSFIFYGAINATPDTSGWDTRQVTDMSHMFRGAVYATPDTSGWDTRQVTDMSYLFSGAINATPDTSGWDTRQVTDMSFMFNEATLANPKTETWDTSQVTRMNYMFYNAPLADPNTEDWNTSQVINMGSMFYNAFNANPNTEDWSMDQVVDMRFMFYNAIKANPNTRKWNLISLKRVDRTFSDSGISSDNYSDFLIIVDRVSPSSPSGIKRLENEIKYNFSAEPARQSLINKGWSINDGGLL